MRIIAKRRLREFWEQHADAKRALLLWHQVAKTAQWSGPADIRATFRTADFVAGDRVIFNIGGNRYRLIVKAIYPRKRLYIRFIGTHAEYDKIDATTI